MLRVGVKQKSRAARPCALYSGIVLTWAAKTERETVPLTPQIFHFENSGSNTTEFLTCQASRQNTSSIVEKFRPIFVRDYNFGRSCGVVVSRKFCLCGHGTSQLCFV